MRERRLFLTVAGAGLVLVVALAARSIWVAYAPSDPTDGRLMNDTQFYYLSAGVLAHGAGYVMPWNGAATAYWPPGYPFFLAGLFKLFGQHVALAWGANIVLGSLTCVALYFVGRIILGERGGIAAGLVLAVFPGHVFFSSLVLSEVTFTFLVVVATLLVLLISRRRGNRSVLGVLFLGAVIGAAALVRGQGLFLIPVAAIFWWLRSGDWRRALRWTGLAALAALAVVLPWTARNYVSMGSFVPISTNEGGNLYIGNYEGATGRVVMGAGAWASERYADLPPAEQEIAVNDLLLREGLKFMFTHPIREVQLSGSKIRALYSDDEEALLGIPNRQAGESIPHDDLIARIGNGLFFGALAVAAGGLLLWLRRPRGEMALPVLVVAVFTLGQLPFFADSRFHYPMLPSIALLAAAGLTAVFDRSVWRRWRAGSRFD
jgi:4-amino-4-deoxy-L-arabinose transferase-like glycosyltransferase